MRAWCDAVKPQHSARRFIALGVFALSCGAPVAPSARADGELAAYVQAADPTYQWREVASGTVGSAAYSELILTSQTWRGIPWKHQLFVLRPSRMDAAGQVFFFIHGGRWKAEYETAPGQLPREAVIFKLLADRLRAPVAVLREVPFQPMFERREDALI